MTASIASARARKSFAAAIAGAVLPSRTALAYSVRLRIAAWPATIKTFEINSNRRQPAAHSAATGNAANAPAHLGSQPGAREQAVYDETRLEARTDRRTLLEDVQDSRDDHKSNGEGWTGISTRSLAATADRASAVTRGNPSTRTQSRFSASAPMSRCRVGLAGPPPGTRSRPRAGLSSPGRTRGGRQRPAAPWPATIKLSG